MTIQEQRSIQVTPLMGKYFTLDATPMLAQARVDSMEAASQMRRHRVRSRNAQVKAMTASIKAASRTKSSKGSSGGK